MFLDSKITDIADIDKNPTSPSNLLVIMPTAISCSGIYTGEPEKPLNLEGINVSQIIAVVSKSLIFPTK